MHFLYDLFGLFKFVAMPLMGQSILGSEVQIFFKLFLAYQQQFVGGQSSWTIESNKLMNLVVIAKAFNKPELSLNLKDARILLQLSPSSWCNIFFDVIFTFFDFVFFRVLCQLETNLSAYNLLLVSVR